MKDSICKNRYNNNILKNYTCTLVNAYVAKLIVICMKLLLVYYNNYMNSFLLITRPNN